jgi:hypothetical protein
MYTLSLGSADAICFGKGASHFNEKDEQVQESSKRVDRKKLILAVPKFKYNYSQPEAST